MTPRLALIDYKAGNLTSVRKALAAVGAHTFTPTSADQLADVSGIIVPGVGHFGATRALDDEWVTRIRHHVSRQRPLLGICLGMQWLYETSEEAPDLSGLGHLSGACFRLPGDAAVGLKVPHVGWNALDITRRDTILGDVIDGAQVYFTHSYVAPVTADTVAVTSHGQAFASVVQRGVVAGLQFHPEKSGDVGLQILRNFIRMTR